MHLSFVVILLASTFRRVSAACSNILLIDDFSKYSSNTNSLGSWTDDDNSMTAMSASSGTLSFTPKSGSIFYETFPCQAANTNGYNALQFTVKGPTGGSFSLELQTQTSCTATSYASKYYTVTGLTGNTQTLTIPWSSWAGANADAIVAIVWYGFSSNSPGWQLSNVQFACSTLASSALPPSSLSVAAQSTIGASSLKATSTPKPPSSSTTTSSRTTNLSTKSRSNTASSLVTKSSIVSSLRPSSSGVKIASFSSVAPRSSLATLSSVASSRKISSTLSPSPSPSPSGVCSNLLIEDFSSQSRLTFLYYNALLQPTSDDGTMKSIVVDSLANRATFTPNSASSYWFSQLGCLNTVNNYGGITMRIKAPAGTTLILELGYLKNCGDTMQNNIDVTSQGLGWTFDGTEKLYSFKFSDFGSGLDASKLSTMLIQGFNKAITIGPISMYCGDTPSEYIVPPRSTVVAPTATVPAPSGTGAALVVDKFDNKDTNALGQWHGADEDLTLTWTSGHVKIVSHDPDYAFYTQLTATCKDLTSYAGSYLHIKYSGSTSFSIALQQHNRACNNDAAPYPETWDEVEASRYASNGDIYVPISHFNVEISRVIGIALKSWYSTAATTLSLIEIVPTIPAGFRIESKLPTGNLIFACKRPNSFAFCIDDGDPTFSQQVLKIIKDADIKVTFFTVGAPLLDPSTNLSNVYKEMAEEGHQIALHSYTHPKMEGLPDYNAIDWEYNNDISVVAQTFNGLHTPYFRPPFGNEGARMRYRWTQAAGRDDAYIVNWSVDVQDWLWATTTTPEKQIDAFKSDVDKGGNLVVMHYLYKSTVDYLPQFIAYAKASGKQLMRLDQCMEDPNAPPI